MEMTSFPQPGARAYGLRELTEVSEMFFLTLSETDLGVYFWKKVSQYVSQRNPRNFCEG